MNVNNMTQAQVEVAIAIQAAGGVPMIAGGAVRDSIMGRKVKDIDMVVFGIDEQSVIFAVRSCVAVKRVEVTGAKFSVITVTCIDGSPIDIAMPRSETKIGAGDKGFDITIDPFMPFSGDAIRRDFTINAMMCHAITGEVHDFFGGVADIEAKVIRAVGPRFVESPDRMVRAGRFAAQFDFDIDPEVIAMCQAMAAAGEFATIFKEKMHDEIEKIAMSDHPSRAFRFFVAAGFGAWMPEVQAMIGCRQDSRHHPEGDVFEHTMQVIDHMARVCNERGVKGKDRVIAFFGAICHDMGKPEVTIIHPDGSITSAGHAQAGVGQARNFMRRMGFENAAMIAVVQKIVAHHMDMIGIVPNDRIIRRVAARIAPMTIEQFVMIVEADKSGRSMGICKPAPEWEAIAIQQACMVQPPVAIIMGRDIVEAGIKPGAQVGAIQRACFAAQIEGVFIDHAGGIKFMRGIIV